MDNIQQYAANFRSPAFPGSFFISFEGIEGAGKSTQIIKIKEYLEAKDFRVLILREPGGTVFGEKLRSAILEHKADLHPLSEAYLFAASRAELLNDVVLKELGTPGTIIICDRYIDSTIAYQGMARGLGVEKVLQMHSTFPLNLAPHMTLYYKISAETSNDRQKMRNAPKDYFEKRGDNFYNSLIEGYETAARIFKSRIKVIDAEKGFDDVLAASLKHVDSLILNQANQHAE